MSVQLGPFFTSDEFGKELTDQDLQNYFLLCTMVLNYVRNEYGVVKITSAKRSAEKNAAVGGVETSQHVRGEAVDFVCPYSFGKGGHPKVFHFITDVLKFSGEVLMYKKKGHLHVGLPRYNVHPDHLILDK